MDGVVLTFATGADHVAELKTRKPFVSQASLDVLYSRTGNRSVSVYQFVRRLAVALFGVFSYL
jgi:hypothetical protein